MEWVKVAVAINTGLRQAEQFKLGWEWVDFSTGIITVPRSKRGEARRIPMNDTVRELLRSLPSRLKSPWVFPSATGETPLDARNYINRVFEPALKRARIENFRWRPAVESPSNRHQDRHHALDEARLRRGPSRSA